MPRDDASLDPVTIRTATLADLPVLLEAGRMFVAESRWGVTFDPARAEHTLRAYLTTPIATVLLAERAGHLLGGAMLVLEWDCQAEPFGMFGKFYMLPWARGTPASRMLARACVDWFDQHGCVASFTGATANVGNDRVFANLMRKVGYELSPDMPTLIRKGSAHA